MRSRAQASRQAGRQSSQEVGYACGDAGDSSVEHGVVQAGVLALVSVVVSSVEHTAVQEGVQAVDQAGVEAVEHAGRR